MAWDVWWVWMAGAIALGILEVFAPGFILLGFAIGAATVGVILLAGGSLVVGLSLSHLLLIFAAASLIGWIVLRRVVGVREGQARIVDRDINED